MPAGAQSGGWARRRSGRTGTAGRGLALWALAGIVLGAGGYLVLGLLEGRWPASATVFDSTPTVNGQPATTRRAAEVSRHSYHEGIMQVAPSVVSLFSRATADNEVPPATDATPDGEGKPGTESDLDSANPGPGAFDVADSQGSGVIIDPAGLVLTNFHLIDGSSEIQVVLNSGDRHAATVLGTDRETDLAVLQIDAIDLPAVPIQGTTRLLVGDIVLAIGNPFGVGQTVTQGIVSATGRQVAGGSAWQNFVQIDAAINPGNSGGALINPDGELVGVTSAVLRRSNNAQGISFAIPAQLLAQVVPQIIARGRVLRGWLGIGADDVAMFPALAKRLDHGAVITGVLAGSPAGDSDLQPGDAVTRLDGQVIDSATDLLLTVSAIKPGRTAQLTVDRDGRTFELAVMLGERPRFDGDVRPRAAAQRRQ